MQLHEYLKKENISVPQFASRIGIHKNTIYLWLNRERAPSMENAQSVVEATQGEVTLDDILYLKKQKKKCPTCGRKLHNKNIIYNKENNELA